MISLICFIYLISTEVTIIIQAFDFLPLHPGKVWSDLNKKDLQIILLWRNLVKKPRKSAKYLSRWVWQNILFTFFFENAHFLRPNRIKASVINTQSARDFLSELNLEKIEREKKIKADVNQKAFLKVVQKSLSQERAPKQKRTFKKIGKNLVLLKLFSRQPQTSNLLLNDPEERFILWKKQ